jgi:Transglycosylase SLT domain
MQPILFCYRCRGMKVSWNSRYILHCLTCMGWLSKSSKLVILTIFLAVLILGFPAPGPFVASGDDHPEATPASGSHEPSARIAESVVQPLETFLKRYGVGESRRFRVAKSIAASAKKYDLDPKLIASVVIVESRANPFAISEKDSVGIMQIHLPTWGDTTDRESINLLKIEDNIDFGARILKDYIRQYGLWEGVKRYKGWIPDDPASEQSVDGYLAKVQNIYGPESSVAHSR